MKTWIVHAGGIYDIAPRVEEKVRVMCVGKNPLPYTSYRLHRITEMRISYII